MPFSTIKREYGEIPISTKHGKGYHPKDEFKLFNRERLVKLVDQIKDSGPDDTAPKRRRHRRNAKAAR